ncbi:UNVERIFIED_CONTAM: tRNA (adenine(37)-N6)-methyltransferase, partial [Sesamum latifolium]
MVGTKSQWLTLSFTLALASLSASTAISVYLWRRKSKSVSNGEADRKIQELEASLKGALEKCAAERQGRIRAQKDLREALSRLNIDKVESTSYPMAPIGVVHSCFSTRNGTPRQPLLVPLAKASLIFDPARVPEASLEGLEGYSHCWIIYVFHLNTDLEKLWKHPSQSKFKAK